MSGFDFPLHCPMCVLAMTPVRDIPSAAPGQPLDMQTAYVYRCAIHGTWIVQPDGKILPHVDDDQHSV